MSELTSELYALGDGVDVAEFPPLLSSPLFIPNASPTLEAVETTFRAKLSKIRAFTWPLLGGRLVLFLCSGLGKMFAMGLKMRMVCKTEQETSRARKVERKEHEF